MEHTKGLREYIRQVDGRFDTAGLEERTNLYLPITCLRGITCCAMAGGISEAGESDCQPIHPKEAGGISEGGISGKNPAVYNGIDGRERPVR
ncbi:hypothetical protein [Extibacter muris]|uniref:hypothetical protein n=1 Tax=Extibacter muris TaxID=1796622 RepID=UPI0021C6E9DA|nr:hypothetical protein [Extibacter muris]